MCAADIHCKLFTQLQWAAQWTVHRAKLDLRQLLSVGYECNVAAEDTFKVFHP